MDKLKKIIAIGTLKGGVGKTSFIYNLGGILAEEGNNVLIIDLDPQANTTANFNFDTDTDLNKETSSNMFIDQVAPMMLVKKSRISSLPTYDLIPSSIKLTETEMQLVASPGREKILLNYIKKHYDWFNKYDYILLDTNPSMSVINQNAFVLADDVILITEPAFNSYTGSQLFYDLWSNISDAIGMNNNVSAIIVNRIDKTEKSSKEFLSFVDSDTNPLKLLFLRNYIPKNVDVKEAAEIENIPINIHNKKSPAYKAMKKIVIELTERGILSE